jgi:hypothetical protein
MSQQYPATKKEKLTGLWERKDKSGKTYMTGKLRDGTKLVIFPNQYKADDGERAADFVLYKEVPIDSEE